MVELPPKYYHDNFEYLLNFVKDKYADLLVESEWRFLRKYYSLPEDAQCLFIRLANRKGLFFKENTLKYEEIADICENLEVLKARGFISALNFEDHKSWRNELLALLTRRELLEIMGETDLKNARKEDISEHLKSVLLPEEIFERAGRLNRVVKVNFEAEVSFLKFLFFGNRSMDMTEFVLRDLGLVQYYRQSDDDLVARFTTRKEAEDKWLVSEQFMIFSEIKTKCGPGQVFDWYCSFRDTNRQLSAVAVPAFQKLQLNIGRHFERCKAFDLAIELYEDAGVPPARERKARSLAQMKCYEEARAVCKEMMVGPYNVDEQYFAEYFLAGLSGKKNRKQTTKWLREADEICISEQHRHSVELGSLDFFLEQGYSGGFSENFPWRTLFGLLFWDIIFDPSLVAFHHPFQRRPSDLYLPDFYEKRADRVLQRLNLFTDSDELVLYLWKTFEENFGTANPFVVWDPAIWEMVKVLVTRLELVALKKIMGIIAQNLVENSRGMPDLLIWNDDHYELLEIKSPNDTLSNQQLFWLKTFRGLGVNARVLRVRFSACAKL